MLLSAVDISIGNRYLILVVFCDLTSVFTGMIQHDWTLDTDITVTEHGLKFSINSAFNANMICCQVDGGILCASNANSHPHILIKQPVISKTVTIESCAATLLLSFNGYSEK